MIYFYSKNSLGYNIYINIIYVIGDVSTESFQASARAGGKRHEGAKIHADGKKNGKRNI